MKRILLLAAMILVPQMMVLAQDVDINKETNMVLVDGKDAFFLTPKNKQFLESDYSLENLQHKELAYLKLQKYGNNISYYMVFTKSGNQCTLTGFGTFGTLKHIAKMIAGANLVQDNIVSETEERKFVILHGGTFIQSTVAAPPTERVIVQEPKHSAQPADIGIKGDKIYNNSEMVGVFRQASAAGLTTVSVYNANDAMVCKATHKDGNDNADWDLVLDGKAITLLYNPASPLEKLFKYLAEKGYL